METQELFYPQIAAQAGPYTFEEGVEIELYSSQDSYFDWAKIRFTEEYQPGDQRGAQGSGLYSTRL